MSNGESSKHHLEKRRRPRSLDRSPSPIQDKRVRWSSTSHRANGEKCSDSSPETSKKGNHQSHSTASSHCLTMTHFVKKIEKHPRALKPVKSNKTTPIDVFMHHRAKEQDVCPPFCGFYWHSTRLARMGTDYIFNIAKGKFQEMSKNNVISWDQCRDMLFDFKKMLDFKYRSMLWHFAMGENCDKCTYWDKVYSAHLAHIALPTQEEEPIDPTNVSDAEMLEVAMEVDGTNQ
ncbi:NP1 [Bocaparvovirus carnivoran6]|nr:NP1 [Bocaparvovirus carnivoran6]